jgi:HrpA-like RNA helicase
MWSARERLLEQVKASSILVVIGETGSGKTTQVGPS